MMAVMISLQKFCVALFLSSFALAKNFQKYAPETTPPIDLNTYDVPNAFSPQEVKKRPIEETNPDFVDGEELVEKDILLTKEQWEYIHERKGLTFPFLYWPEIDGIPTVPFTFGDDLVDQDAVMAGIQHWESHTCIRFEPTSDLKPRIIFWQLLGCYSNIGYLGVLPEYGFGQNISIGIGCTQLGIVAHEIGHSLGLFHEHVRPDRDSYVHINTDNIIPLLLSNFQTVADSMINNFSVPYDFHSAMHYGTFVFSGNGRPTIVTLNPLDQELLGNQEQLTHRDILIVNRMYGCIDKWLENCSMTTDPCQNDGFTGADCACVCPPGTSGAFCEIEYAEYYALQRTSCNEIITSPQTITSPNYPNNYPADVTCAKWIQAPVCTTPRVTFNAFNLPPEYCYYDFVEIRTDNPFNGTIYCGTDITTGFSVTSPSNEIIIMFYTRTSSGIGWSAEVSFDEIPFCPTTSTTTTPPESDCTYEFFADSVNWISPNFPSNYSNNVFCDLEGNSETPAVARYTFNAFNLQEKNKRTRKCVDYVGIDIPYQRQRKLCDSKSGFFNIPGYRFHDVFVTNHAWNDTGFNITVSRVSNECTSLIQLDDSFQGEGVITTPNYPGSYPVQTSCEWWIQAPVRKQVQVNFTSISFRSSKCTKSYIVVDRSGSGNYLRADSNMICRSLTPTLLSDANQINIAFYGGNLPSSGFRATYSLV